MKCTSVSAHLLFSFLSCDQNFILCIVHSTAAVNIATCMCFVVKEICEKSYDSLLHLFATLTVLIVLLSCGNRVC